MKNTFMADWDDIFGISNKRNIVHQVSNDTETVLSINVAGYEPKDVDVDVNNGSLKITSKEKNVFEDTINLEFNISENLEPKPTSAIIENGVLAITFKKRDKKEKTKIKVTY